MGKIFTPEAWAESCEGLKDTSCATEENDCPRGPMVRSLLRQHLTVGVSRDAVVGLLGPADWDRAECLHWSLGACSGLGIDYDSLFVCFDKTGHLVEAGHVQH